MLEVDLQGDFANTERGKDAPDLDGSNFQKKKLKQNAPSHFIRGKSCLHMPFSCGIVRAKVILK